MLWLVMGIQTKSVRGLVAEPLVGSVRSIAPHEQRVSGGGAQLTQEIFWTFFCSEIWRNYYFFHFFRIFWNAFWYNLGQNFDNIIYGDIVVYFLTIFSSKSTISQQNENRKNQKIVFSSVSEHCAFFSDNSFFGHFGWFNLINFFKYIFCVQNRPFLKK